MTSTELGTLTGFGVLLLNAGIQWGVQLAERKQHAKEIERLAFEAKERRTECSAKIAGVSTQGHDRLDDAIDAIRAIGKKIDDGQAATNERLGEVSLALGVLTARVDALERGSDGRGRRASTS